MTYSDNNDVIIKSMLKNAYIVINQFEIQIIYK